MAQERIIDLSTRRRAKVEQEDRLTGTVLDSANDLSSEISAIPTPSEDTVAELARDYRDVALEVNVGPPSREAGFRDPRIVERWGRRVGTAKQLQTVLLMLGQGPLVERIDSALEEIRSTDIP